MELSSITSALYSGLNGYNKAQQGVAEAADNISKLNADRAPVAPEQLPPQNVAGAAELANSRVDSNRYQTDLNAEAVNLIVNEHLGKASVKVMKTADEMLGTLIDTKA